MRSTPFKNVFDRVIRLWGRDPRKNISSDMANAIVDQINYRTSTMVELWRWPEWEITEERAFRQVWSVTHQYLRVNPVDNQPDEVFYLGDSFVSGGDFGANFGYYRVVANPPTDHDPPIGTPPTNMTYFEPISPLDTFIAYDQPCKRSIGMVMGIYNQNPRVPTGCKNGALRYEPSEFGIDVINPGVPTVFVNYKMPTPEYTMTPWVLGKTYVRADLVFDPATGECFQAVTTTTHPVTTATDWNWVPFLSRWIESVVKGAFADTLMEFDQKGNEDLQARVALQQYWSQDADDMFQQEVDKLVIEGQKLQWNFCKPRHGRCCESESWSGGAIVLLGQ